MKTLEVLLNPDGHLIAKDGVNAANPPGAGAANDDNKVDQAVLFHRELALLQHQQRVSVDIKTVFAEFCEECGNPIPEKRRLAFKARDGL